MMTHPNRRTTKILRLASAAILAVMVFHVGKLHAATMLLPIDFEKGTGITEDGFNSFAVGVSNSAPINMVYGPLTVGISGQEGSGDRDSLTDGGALTYADLYDDFIIDNDDNDAVPITITISGLDPTETYLLKLYSYDNTLNNPTSIAAIGTNTTTFVPNTALGTTGTSGSVTWTAQTPPTTNDQYSTTLILHPNGSGQISVLASAIRDDASPSHPEFRLRVNGFILYVPEPASLTLMVVGLTLVHRRRRKA